MSMVVQEPDEQEEAYEIPIGGSDSPTTDDPSDAFVGGAADDVYDIEIQVRTYATEEDVATPVTDFLTGLLRMIAQNLEQMAPQPVQQVQEMLQTLNVRQYLEPDFWHGVGSIVEYQAREQLQFLERRFKGEYATDPYGMDADVVEIVRPFLGFMYHTWWRISASGLEYVPHEGRTLLVSNHSGVLPWDGAMIANAVYEEHSGSRLVRNLFLHWFSTLPFVGNALVSTGGVPGLQENAVRLLQEEQVVCTFPEGVKGVGKLFQDRYRLARFGRGGFVQTALRTGAPLVPVAVIGAEEIYPMLANAEPLAKMFGLPYFPITPTFPWLGPLGAIPLPTRWSITFGPPVDLGGYGPDDADDPLVVFMLSERVRTVIQEMINARLSERTALFS